jgi:hypothetical protein
MKDQILCFGTGRLGQRLLLLVSALCLGSGLRLHAATWGPFSYEREGDTIAITGYKGAERSVTIPETIEGRPVTSLAPSWGWEGDSVTNLSLPATLISLGNPLDSLGDSLDGLESLEAIAVAEGNPQFSSRDGLLFSRDQTTLLRCPQAWAGDYSVPETVRRIGARAFSLCRNLERLTLPEGVTEVGERAFEGCSSLISVTAGADLVPAVVAAGSRSGRIDPASHLRFLIVNEHVAITGHDYWESVIEFWSSGPPIEVEIPPRFDGRPVTFIGSSACQAMALSTVTIPASVSWIGEGAFAYCSRLTRIDVAADNPFYRSVEGVLFDAPLQTLLQYPGGRVGDFAVPAGVRRISSDSFADCPGLTGVTIPDSVTAIGDRAFWKCPNLGFILFGAGVSSIGEQALDTRGYFCDSWGGPPCWGGNCGCHYYGAALELYFLGDAPTGGGFFGERGLPTRREDAGRWQAYDLSPPPAVRFLPWTGGWGRSLDGMPSTPWGGEPVLLSQPQSHTGYAGSAWQISVRAAGPGPMRYQWEHEGADADAATGANHALSPLQPRDAGFWRVRVSNAYGSTTSQMAKVTVRTPAPGSYEAAAVALDPLAYWPLDEAEGGTATDFVTGSPGNFVGATRLGEPGATPNTGHSIGFDGTSGVVAPHNPAWDVGTGDFTVAAWINPTDFYPSGLVAKGGYGWAQGWLLEFSAMNEGTLSLGTLLETGDSLGSVQTAPGVVKLNEWQQVVVSCRRDPAVTAGSNLTGNGWTRIYRNGRLVASGDIGVGNLNNPDLPLTIGNIGNGDLCFPGRMDEVALFGEALSAEQVADLYAAGIGAPRPLRFIRAGEQFTLTWTGGVLQSASTLGDGKSGPDWADIPGATSPFTLETTSGAGFFRVRMP